MAPSDRRIAVAKFIVRPVHADVASGSHPSKPTAASPASTSGWIRLKARRFMHRFDAGIAPIVTDLRVGWAAAVVPLRDDGLPAATRRLGEARGAARLRSRESRRYQAQMPARLFIVAPDQAVPIRSCPCAAAA